MEKRFCVKCEKLLPKPSLINIGKEKVFEFKDGYYCEKCARVKVEGARK